MVIEEGLKWASLGKLNGEKLLKGVSVPLAREIRITASLSELKPLDYIVFR